MKITEHLAEQASHMDFDKIPHSARHEAKRSLLNHLGCAIGGSGSPTVNLLIKAVKPVSGPPQAVIMGMKERLDIVNAAMVNGAASHVFDFDDTQQRRILIHPTGPVASALLAIGEHLHSDGRRLFAALMAGIEAACRINNAVYPYDHVHWHTTSTAGAIGAAVGVSVLLGLDTKRTRSAIGLAATQASGLRVMLGSQAKSFNVGHAARNGLLAALMAREGFESAPDAIEGVHGFAEAHGHKEMLEEICRPWGENWEIQYNTYKPFACGIICHPVIDACIQLRGQYGFSPEEVESVHLDVFPLVLDLTGKTDPRTSLESKFSIYHCAAVALIYGCAHEDQFSDECVRIPETMAMRKKVSATAVANLEKYQARVQLKLTDGRLLVKQVEKPYGSLENPVSDEDLEDKVRILAAAALSSERVERLIELCWNIEELADTADLAIASTPN